MEIHKGMERRCLMEFKESAQMLSIKHSRYVLCWGNIPADLNLSTITQKFKFSRILLTIDCFQELQCARFNDCQCMGLYSLLLFYPHEVGKPEKTK